MYIYLMASYWLTADSWCCHEGITFNADRIRQHVCTDWLEVRLTEFLSTASLLWTVLVVDLPSTGLQ